MASHVTSAESPRTTTANNAPTDPAANRFSPTEALSPRGVEGANPDSPPQEVSPKPLRASMTDAPPLRADTEYRASFLRLNQAVAKARACIRSDQKPDNVIGQLEIVQSILEEHAQNFPDNNSPDCAERALMASLTTDLNEWTEPSNLSPMSMRSNDRLQALCAGLGFTEIAGRVKADQSKSRATADLLVQVLTRDQSFGDSPDFGAIVTDLRKMASLSDHYDFAEQFQEMFASAVNKASEGKTANEVRLLQDRMRSKGDMFLLQLRGEEPCDAAFKALQFVTQQGRRDTFDEKRPDDRPPVRQAVPAKPSRTEQQTKRNVVELMGMLAQPKRIAADIQKLIARFPRGYEHEVEFHRIFKDELEKLEPFKRSQIVDAAAYIDDTFAKLIDAAYSDQPPPCVQAEPSHKERATDRLLYLLETFGAGGKAAPDDESQESVFDELEALQQSEFSTGYFDYKEMRQIADAQLEKMPAEQLRAIQKGIDLKFHTLINGTVRDLKQIDEHVFMRLFSKMLLDAVESRLQLNRAAAQQPRNNFQRAWRFAARPFKAMKAFRDRDAIGLQKTRALIDHRIGKSLTGLSRPTNDSEAVGRGLNYISRAMPGSRGEADRFDIFMHIALGRGPFLAPTPQERIQFNAHIQLALSKLTTGQVMAILDNIERRGVRLEDTFHVRDLRDRLKAELGRRPNFLHDKAKKVALAGELITAKRELQTRAKAIHSYDLGIAMNALKDGNVDEALRAMESASKQAGQIVAWDLHANNLPIDSVTANKHRNQLMLSTLGKMKQLPGPGSIEPLSDEQVRQLDAMFQKLSGKKVAMTGDQIKTRVGEARSRYRSDFGKVAWAITQHQPIASVLDEMAQAALTAEELLKWQEHEDGVAMDTEQAAAFLQALINEQLRGYNLLPITQLHAQTHRGSGSVSEVVELMDALGYYGFNGELMESNPEAAKGMLGPYYDLIRIADATRANLVNRAMPPEGELPNPRLEKPSPAMSALLADRFEFQI